MKKTQPQYAALKSIIKQIESGQVVVTQVEHHFHRQRLDSSDGESIEMDLGSTFTIHLSRKVISKFRQKIRVR